MQVIIESLTAHERASAASLRSITRGAGAVLESEWAVVRHSEVGRALLMRDEVVLIMEHASAAMIHCALRIMTYWVSW